MVKHTRVAAMWVVAVPTWRRRTVAMTSECAGWPRWAAATFVANTIAELYVIQRYLQPERLAATRLGSFDDWAATFGRSVTALELAPEGGSYRTKGRLARFGNVPELLAMFGAVADVRTAEELALPRPRRWRPRDGGGGPHRGPGRLHGHPHRARRAGPLWPSSRQGGDNLLVIMNGRAGALDVRLVGLSPGPAAQKLDVAAERIAAIWRQTRTSIYTDASRAPSPVPGALQLVFTDRSTPSARWNAYDELRAQLVARGLPGERVRFVHGAQDDRAKAELFAACREGRVSVLVGSTAKMGIGTNVQARGTSPASRTVWPVSTTQRRPIAPRPWRRAARWGRSRPASGGPSSTRAG